MSAREHARRAAWAIPDNHPDLPNRNVYVDAASDVWEPIVKELMEALRVTITQEAWTEAQAAQLDRAYARAKEALG